MKSAYHSLHLILGDQLNAEHPWYTEVDDSRLFVMMELQQELSYVTHHIAKITAFFAAMEQFAQSLREKGHHVLYRKLDDEENTGTLADNLNCLKGKYSIRAFYYQLPDEYRLDEQLKAVTGNWDIPCYAEDTAHFLSTRHELAAFFKGKQYIMESWYRMMRKKYRILMDGESPLEGRWNFDRDNRQRPDKNLKDGPILHFGNNVEAIAGRILQSEIPTLGTVDARNFRWPVNRQQSLKALEDFVNNRLPLFGTYQDAMVEQEPFLYHALLSFSLNTKMLHPLEVINAAVQAYEQGVGKITTPQVEGFVRQILGWREYVRGIYWAEMPHFGERNYFRADIPLPKWFWTGNTAMNCLHQSIKGSLENAYAHHIQRLMITGNFALLAGIKPDEVDTWYLGIYIDAIEWVEITNTRGMALFADGGLVGTKPYAAGANYINNMSNYCKGCKYDPKKRVGPNACPFNALYWNFYITHADQLENHPRIGFVYRNLNRMTDAEKQQIASQAREYLLDIDNI